MQRSTGFQLLDCDFYFSGLRVFLASTTSIAKFGNTARVTLVIRDAISTAFTNVATTANEHEPCDYS